MYHQIALNSHGFGNKSLPQGTSQYDAHKPAYRGM